MSTLTLPRRSDVPLAATWDLESVFATPDTYEAAFTSAEDDLPALAAFRGRLSEGAAVVADFFALFEPLQRRVSQIAVYANLRFTEDTGDTEAAARADRAVGLSARFAAAVAFLEPELLAIGAPELMSWCEIESRIAHLQHYFDRLTRREPHVRSAEVEQVLSQAREAFFAANRIHAVLCDADLQFGEAVGADGVRQEIAQGTIAKLLTEPDREVRRTAWERYADRHLAVKNALAGCLSAGVKQNVFTARVRGYASPLEAAVAPNFIPTAVFENLIATFRRHLPVWHRYWGIRRRALRLEKLAAYDIKAPLAEHSPAVPYPQAVEWIADGMAPLGDAYVAILRRGATSERWVDWMPNRGKRMGAFSSGTAGTNPFILMSYNDDLFSLSTLAHEFGHSLHSYLTRRDQPQVYMGYGLFAAEVASNFNQALVRAHLLERFADDRDFQIAVIEEAMSNFHRYFFVMPTLARFEKEIHERVWRGEALTEASLTNLMADLFGEAYGPEVDTDGPARVRIGSTWMQFSTHLYANFYVYQYATGIAGAHALAAQVLAEGAPAAERYLAFLSAGGSDYPLELLRRAGVDLESPEPVEAAFATMSGYIDRLEQLLAR